MKVNLMTQSLYEKEPITETQCSYIAFGGMKKDLSKQADAFSHWERSPLTRVETKWPFREKKSPGK
jgi:hypothetical protein